jgi:SulP family sulfate permease
VETPPTTAATTPATLDKRLRSKRGRGIGDAVGGFVAGLYSVPEGIGYASLAGVNPMLGIYSGMVPVAVSAATTGSVLMMSTLTSAIALTMGGVLDDADYTGSQVPRAVFTMALVAGAIMVVLGALRLGKVVNFVSNSVMTGFVMGVAILIMVGKFDEIFGYDPSGYSNKVVKAADILVHPGSWNLTTTAVGLGTIGLAFALKAVPGLARYALVLVVVIGTAVVWVFGIDTALIRDQATILTGLDAVPIPTSVSDLPDPGMVPTLLVGSISIAIVALAQGAGIRPAFPNPDGSPASASRDFLGQGLGNVAGAFFQSTPSGGSLSRTAVSADGGATSRLAGYAAAAAVVVLVVVFGSAVGHVPEAVIGGLLFVIGVELITGRLPDARLAWRAGTRPRVLFAVTLILTLTIQLQWAIIAGAVLSLLAFVVASASGGQLQRLVRDDSGWLLSDEIPALLPAGEPVSLRYTGPDFFADVPGIVEQLPEPDLQHAGVLVLDIGALQSYSSTMLKALGKYHASLAAAGSGLVLSGVSDGLRNTLAETSLLEQIGLTNVLPAEPHFDVALEQGLRRGQELLAELQQCGAASGG